MTGADRRLELMGTRIGILVGPPARPGLPGPEDAAARVEAFLRDYDRALSRFRPDSELSALNADPRPVVPASPLLRSAIRAALAAAHGSGGLVDPTVHDDLLAAGYRDSWDPARRLDLRDALAAATTPRAAARPNPASLWREITVDDAAGTIRRPPRLRLDTGGTGKGHAADLAGALLDGYAHWAVDCGGDVRIGGAPRRVDVACPFGRGMLEGFAIRDGAVATSGLSSRIWRAPGGATAHHLLDPATGRPCFTGLASVTAVAPTGVEAETLAKTALLRGPDGARRVLARHGGVLVHEDGAVERLAPRPVVRLRLPERGRGVAAAAAAPAERSFG
ncbi:MAG: FAD:protein FMN transferase [Solirubrobacterales bacterium]|nr:FAD:protein FMN transferase [Solirubrobacterales bacterium]